jgi:hypothetical protein
MILSTLLEQRRELGDFVRSQREKLPPKKSGCPAAPGAGRPA